MKKAQQSDSTQPLDNAERNSGEEIAQQLSSTDKIENVANTQTTSETLSCSDQPLQTDSSNVSNDVRDTPTTSGSCNKNIQASQNSIRKPPKVRAPLPPSIPRQRASQACVSRKREVLERYNILYGLRTRSNKPTRPGTGEEKHDEKFNHEKR